MDEDRILKQFFHGLRYSDIWEQLVRTTSICDFKQASHLLAGIRALYINNRNNTDFVVDYLRLKSEDYKSMTNQLSPTEPINATFQAHTTVVNPDRE